MQTPKTRDRASVYVGKAKDLSHEDHAQHAPESLCQIDTGILRYSLVAFKAFQAFERLPRARHQVLSNTVSVMTVVELHHRPNEHLYYIYDLII